MDRGEVKVSTGTSILSRNDSLPLHILVIGDFEGADLADPAAIDNSSQQNPFPSLRTVNDSSLDSFFASLNVDIYIELNDFFTADVETSCIRFKPRNIHDFTPIGLLESVPEFRALKFSQHKMQELINDKIDAQQFATALEPYCYIKPLRMLCQDIKDLSARDTEQFGARQTSNRYKCVSQATEYVIDTEVSKFLHHPNVQKLEALWRGLKFLIDRTNFQNAIQIDCLNTPYDKAIDSFEHFVIEQHQQNTNTVSYSLIVNTFTLENSSGKIANLEKLAKIAEALQTPLLFSLSHEFFGNKQDEPISTILDPVNRLNQTEFESWNALRKKSCARWLVALYNNFLLRNQYELDMRTASGVTEHINKLSQRLWGNPVFALTSLITHSFATSQWVNNIQGREYGRIDNLPLFSLQTYVESGSFQTLESTISLEQAEDFATQGITTLSCTQNEDCAYIYHAPCIYDVTAKSAEFYSEISGDMNNLPYQMLFSRIAHQIQQNYEKLSQISDPAILKSAVTTILQSLISSTGDGATLGVSVSDTDDDSGRHIISIEAITGNEILSGSRVEFGLMV